MSSDGTNNYNIYSTENTSPLEEPDPIPPFEMESSQSDTLEEYDPGGYDDGDDGDDEGGNNSRLFMILLGGLAGLFIISIIVMVVLSQLVLPGQRAARTEAYQGTVDANEQIVIAATETAQAEVDAEVQTRIAGEVTNTPTATETVMMPTETPTPEEAPTETPEPALPTDTPEPEEDVTPDQTQTEQALQETVDALATDAAGTPTPTEEGGTEPTLNPAQLTATAQASGGSGGVGSGEEGEEELPDTGFMDDGGIYVMGVAAILLVGVIIGARKLRKAS